jgi:putative membrane protein
VRRRNEGSAARDHLANERTYLAWLRTGLGTAAFGTAVAHLLADADSRAVLAAGLALISLAVAMIVYGTLRFVRSRRALEEGEVEVDRIAPIAFGGAAAVVTVLLVLVVL